MWENGAGTLWKKKPTYIYFWSNNLLIFSKYVLKEPLVKEEEAQGVAWSGTWEFSAAGPLFPGWWCQQFTQVTDFKCLHYPATSAGSQVAKWQWEVGMFKVSPASVLHPYCKMFDFPLQKKEMCHQQSALPCTFSWDRRDASANIWTDVKALLKKWALMRISFQFGGK